jgi:hypothetical protein
MCVALFSLFANPSWSGIWTHTVTCQERRKPCNTSLHEKTPWTSWGLANQSDKIQLSSPSKFIFCNCLNLPVDSFSWCSPLTALQAHTHIFQIFRTRGEYLCMYYRHFCWQPQLLNCNRQWFVIPACFTCVCTCVCVWGGFFNKHAMYVLYIPYWNSMYIT